MEFANKIVVITGGAKGIGAAIAEAFQKEGATICIIDKNENPYFVGDIGKQEDLEVFAQKVISDYGKVDVLVNNAMETRGGLDVCGYADFTYALQVGVVAPYYLTKLFLPYFTKDASILNISSSRDRMSQANTESYTAAKGGIAALTHGLAVSLSGKVRVNSISPGWIDTTNTTFTGADATQHLAGRVGKPSDIANMVLYLSSEKASFIDGENICIDGGMTKQMIYHDDFGWKLS
ncbi:SDR family oxidoreductase [Chakrabartyella piscis]|uniref:SDR family oxidoreductase n=1 Tax=Chakrabartyella piscis TaxID=2918914 RepID=UPI00295836C7|nr:SDR family oxidoreductase [Chakrabartyella piscis]